MRTCQYSFSTALLWIAAILAITIFPQHASAQGCVAGRCPVGVVNSLHSGLDLQPGSASRWQASVGYRWLHSDRHYVGTDYHEERAEERSQVINDQNSIDFGLSYNINDRWSVSLSVPYVDNNRGSALRNAAREVVGRSNVSVSGIGDVRLGVNYWLWDPSGHLGAVESTPTGKGKAPTANAPAASGRRGNIRLSIGVDMPTGEEDAKDYRRVYNNTTGRIETDPIPRIVDQSIQPGDGGWGIPIDIYAYYNFTHSLTGYFQGSYLITPEGTNGVPTGRGGAGEGIMSIGDTFMARAGLEYNILPRHGVSMSLGLRTEGQPSEDLFGSSLGFRRPGMNIAVEPGVTWMKNGWSASLLWPIVFYNNRFQSIPDQNASTPANARHGDAAFAQSYVMFVVGKQF